MTSMKVHMLHVPGAPGRGAVVEHWRHEPGVDLVVHEDPKRQGVMWNWSQAMASILRNREHLEQPWTLVVQDDVLPAAAHWLEEFHAATAHSPSDMLGLFYLGGLGTRTAERGAPYATGKDCLWGAAYAINNEIIEDMARWCITVWQRTGYKHDDGIMRAFMIKQQQQIAVTARSLFTIKRVPSLMGHAAHVQPQPSLTIADDGPAWDATPRAVSAGRTPTEDVLELAKEYAWL